MGHRYRKNLKKSDEIKSPIQEIQQLYTLTRNLPRKNDFSFEKKDKKKDVKTEPSQSANFDVPLFQPKKIRDNKNFQRRLKQLQQRKSVSNFLEQNVKNWMVIN